MTYNDNEGRVYPLSNSAKSVIDVIGNAINKKNISTFLEHEIMSITYKGKKFYIETNKENFECEKLVVATGGNSLNEFLDLYKIKHREIHPSLCALKTTSTRNLENVRISDVEITLENGSDKKSNAEKSYLKTAESVAFQFSISPPCLQEKVII